MTWICQLDQQCSNFSAQIRISNALITDVLLSKQQRMPQNANKTNGHVLHTSRHGNVARFIDPVEGMRVVPDALEAGQTHVHTPAHGAGEEGPLYRTLVALRAESAHVRHWDLRNEII